MSWLRLDDKFPAHPKVAQLSDREFRVHMRVLCYCAEYRTKGELPTAIWNEIPGLTRTMGERFTQLQLWDKDDETGALSVHDWAAYNPEDPTAAERMRRHRSRKRDESVTDTVTPTVTDDVTPGVLAGARARPVPSFNPPDPPEGGTVLSRRQLRRYTGCKLVRGSHGIHHVRDPLGTDKPPPDWPHEPPAEIEVVAARLAENGAMGDLEARVAELAQRYSGEQLDQAFEVWGLGAEDRIKLADVAADAARGG